MAYSYSGRLHSNRNKWTTAKWNNVIKSHKHNVGQIKPHIKNIHECFLICKLFKIMGKTRVKRKTRTPLQKSNFFLEEGK